MVIAYDPRGKRDYVLPDERERKPDPNDKLDPNEQPKPKFDPSKQTVWELTDLTERTQIELWDMVSLSVVEGGSAAASLGSRTFKVLRVGLTGWRNFKDSAGNEVLFERDAGGVKESLLERIPWAVKIALSNAIQSHSTPDADDLEKSEPSPTA